MGKVIWHSLDESGYAAVYDIRWPSGRIETDIPVKLLEAVMMGKHETDEQHGVREQFTPIHMRKYKD